MERLDKTPEESAKSRSVSLLPKTWDRVESIATAEFTSNRSAYFAKLIGEDFERRDRDEKRERLRQKFDELVARIGEEKLNVILANLAMQEVAA